VKVIVDTPIWSLVMRRRGHPENEVTVSQLGALVDEKRIAIIGPIRQELLSGIREPAHYERVRRQLRAFPDTDITLEDYEAAAGLYNRCREKGIQGSATDFLICAIAVRHGFSIFTTDGDFHHFATILPIVLYEQLQ